MPRPLPTLSYILEVERKFHSLAVQELSANHGRPSFRSIRALGQRTIHDVYYDRASRLSSAGVWVRQRNGHWGAKIRKGGDFINSRFEEVSESRAISRCITEVIGGACSEDEQFGLEKIADFVTTRKTWVADDEFQIVLDTTDFGHTIGEVELQQQSSSPSTITEVCLEREKQEAMQRMDDRIAGFMERYAWAFCPGTPKGKLTAYFERNAL